MNPSINNNLSPSSSFMKRFNAWAKERFPLVNIISGSLSYITMISLGKFIAGKDFSQFSSLDILGATAFVGHLLLLRIFDEHKDYEIDKKNHPDRALSKGLINLKHLKLIAIPLPLIGLTWSLLHINNSNHVLILWVFLFIYSLLMAKEFFMGEWLSKKLALYSISHMLVSPIMILWIIVGGSSELIASSLIYYVLAVSFTGGISYELTRKTRGKDEDMALDSYNKSFGLKGSIAITSFFNIISLLLGFLIIQEISLDKTISATLLVIGYISTIYPTYHFIKKPLEKSRKINEGGVGIFLLGLYTSILAALFV